MKGQGEVMRSLSIQEIQKITDRVDGWLGKWEGPYLYSLAKIGSTKGAIIEIGSWKGKSTIWLAKGSKAVNGEKVYAIDPHIGGPDYEKLGYKDIHTEGEFKENIRIAGVESIVILLVETSMEVVRRWDLPIGFLWIDGDHGYKSVRDDFFSWEPYVVEGGVIALHDTYSQEGVRRVVDEEILRIDKFQVLGQVDGILAVKKVRSLSPLHRVKRGLVIYLRQIFNKARIERRHWRALPRKLLRGISIPKNSD